MKYSVSLLLVVVFSYISCKFNIKQTIVKEESKSNIDTTYKNLNSNIYTLD